MGSKRKLTLSWLALVLFISTFFQACADPFFQTTTTQPIIDKESFITQSFKLIDGTALERKCSLLNNFYMSDVDLVVDSDSSIDINEIIIPAHKVILAFQSAKFENILNSFSEARPRFVVRGLSQDIFNILIK